MPHWAFPQPQASSVLIPLFHDFFHAITNTAGYDLDFYDDEDYVNEDETEGAEEADVSDDEAGEIEEDI